MKGRERERRFVVANLKNLKVLEDEKLVERAERPGKGFVPELRRIQSLYPDVLGCCHGMGLVAGIQAVKAGTKTPDPALALKINPACLYQRARLIGT